MWDQNGGKQYIQIPVIASNKKRKKVDDLVICRIDGDMIEELHNQAGKDEWSMDWLEEAIKKIIEEKPVVSKTRFIRRKRQ